MIKDTTSIDKTGYIDRGTIIGKTGGVERDGTFIKDPISITMPGG